MPKDKKRDRSELSEAVDHGEAPANVSDSEDTAAKAAKKAAKAAKKAAKKAKKSEEENVGSAAPAAAAAAAASDEEEEEDVAAAKAAKKAAKKAKKETEGGSSIHRQVGLGSDQSIDLASSSGSDKRYKMHEVTKTMSASTANKFRADARIQVTPEQEGDTYKPITHFDQLAPSLNGYCPYVQKYVSAKNFTAPTSIQAQCWPALLSGRDVIGIASTGSGKTLSFLIPGFLLIAYMEQARNNSVDVHRKGGYGVPKPKILVVAPTRELAMQSYNVVAEISGGPKGACIYGGAPKQAQREALREGSDIVVATPGRLIDLLESGGFLSLEDARYVVLDEADRMLDQGFEKDIQRILGMCPMDRQTVMFSATWPVEIRQLAEKYMKPNVFRVTVGSEELSANHRVTQIVECVEPRQKDPKLFGLLDKYHKSRTNRILIFTLYKNEAAQLHLRLQAKGFKVGAIHGDKGQGDRFKALEDFKNGSVPLLIATDVAARGLDIPQVEYVINYSFPLTVEDYVHRIGRTGRAGASGISHTFFTDFDKGLAGALVGVLQEAKQDVPQEIFKYPMVTKKKTSKLYGEFGPKAELQGQKATKITFD